MSLSNHPSYALAKSKYAEVCGREGGLHEFVHSHLWHATTLKGNCIPGVHPENTKPVDLMIERGQLLEALVEDGETLLRPEDKDLLAKQLQHVVIADFEHNPRVHPVDREATFLGLVTDLNQKSAHRNTYRLNGSGGGHTYEQVLEDARARSPELRPIRDDLPNPFSLRSTVLLREAQRAYLSEYVTLMARESARPIPNTGPLFRALQSLRLYLGDLERSRALLLDIHRLSEDGVRKNAARIMANGQPSPGSENSPSLSRIE